MATAVTIFHTADLHNRLPRQAAEHLAHLKRAEPGSLLLDAGDALRAGNLGFSLLGEPILRQMKETGYDAMAMGNRESHLLQGFLERKLREAAFPVLAANMVPLRRPAPAVVRSHIVFATPAGPRVAVMGLCPRMLAANSVWSRLADYIFEEPVATAAHLAEELKDRADLVVCLSHCGLSTDMELAAIPAVDLVLGGHSHSEQVEQVPGSALVIHPGCHGHAVSCTRLAGRNEVEAEVVSLENGK